MNVNAAFYGQQARDERRDPIRSNDRTESLIYLQNFCNWLKQWKNTAGMRGLSDQTFQAAIQTAQTVPPMITHLFDTKNLDYVLTGHIQSDYLESRFGWYRQLCAANYYNPVLQFLQCEKTIRVRSLVKMGFNLSEIKKIFESAPKNISHEVDQNITSLLNVIGKYLFEDTSTSSDHAIVYYISGYIARNLIKN